MCVNATRDKQSNLRAHYNRSRFHPLFGRTSLWILLQAYPNREINQSSWWLLIVFPSMLIFALFNTRLHHPRWLKFLLLFLYQSVISVVILISFQCYCGDYFGYIVVILPFLAFYLCSAYFLYLVYYKLEHHNQMNQLIK
jgi:predicted RND superfamily exporter protein